MTIKIPVPDKPEKCPKCGRDYVYRDQVQDANWIRGRDGYRYIHEVKQKADRLVIIEDSCYVES